MNKTKQNPQESQPALCTDTKNLIKEVQRIMTENRRTLMQIRQTDPQFCYKLYQPITHYGIDEMFVRPLLLRQVDLLLEERQVLSTKREVINFGKMEQKKKQEQQLRNSSNHFYFLRSTWTKLQSQSTTTSQKIDNLNKIIGNLRTNIKKLTESQQKVLQKQLSQCCQIPKNLSHISKKDQKLQQQIQRIKMRNQQLQSKCLRYDQIILEKNRKIQMLQWELFQAGTRIKESMDTLSGTSEKLVSLKRGKSLLEGQVKRLRDGEVVKGVVFSSGIYGFAVKIEGSGITGIKMEETHKSLTQILEFLRSKPSQIPASTQRSLLDTTTSQIQIPSLNLTLNLPHTHCQPQQESPYTDRHLSKLTKFIPMRTQRSCTLRSQQQRQKNMSNVEELEENEENNQSVIQDVCQRRFIRKVELALTSDRFRKYRGEDFRGRIDMDRDEGKDGEKGREELVGMQ